MDAALRVRYRIGNGGRKIVVINRLTVVIRERVGCEQKQQGEVCFEKKTFYIRLTKIRTTVSCTRTCIDPPTSEGNTVVPPPPDTPTCFPATHAEKEKVDPGTAPKKPPKSRLYRPFVARDDASFEPYAVPAATTISACAEVSDT